MIFIIIPVFNRWRFTRDCLISLKEQTYKDFKIIVVDHGSTDGTSEYVAKEFPDIIVLKGDHSMWWTAATNMGINYALKNGATYVLTLNNDTIATENYLFNLVQAVDIAPQYSLIGSTAIAIESQEVIYCGEKVNWFTETSFYWHKCKIISSELLPVNVFPGRGLLIHREVFEKVGLFDAFQFPHYVADYDFTLRAQKIGFNIYCAYNARICTYPEESGAHQLLKKKSFKSYIKYLTSIKGTGNLKHFLSYAFKHCPINALPFYLILGTSRRLLGYWLR